MSQVECVMQYKLSCYGIVMSIMGVPPLIKGPNEANFVIRDNPIRRPPFFKDHVPMV